MIKIIEHKDYNKPADNETVLEIEQLNGRKSKVFKVFDGVWLDPKPVDIKELPIYNGYVIPPYQKDYCSTIEQKSKYLEQMTILFNRINSCSFGQSLLEELNKGSPIDFSNTNIWNETNMIVPRTKDNAVNRKLRATCVLRPNSSYLESVAHVQGTFKANKIDTTKGFVYFHPDCVYSIKKDNKINYFDPAVPLYHELLHVCHSMYGIVGSNDAEEEYVTFGKLEARYFLDTKSTLYKVKQNILETNLRLIKQKIDNIQDPIDKTYFENKYGFQKKTIVNKEFVDRYIYKYQVVPSEHNFAKNLNLNGSNIRTSYEDDLFLAFKFDISDPKVYTIKKGFLNPSDTIENLQANPSNIFGDLELDKVVEILKECGITKSKREVHDNLTLLEPQREDIQLWLAKKHLAEKSTDDTTAPRKKRGTTDCKRAIADILENIDTVVNKAKEIPGKILRQHSKELIESIPQDKVLNKPPKNLGVEKNYRRLETFKAGSLVGFDRITPNDITNAHRFNHDLIDMYDFPLEFTSDNINHAKNFSNIIYTHNNSITKQMKLMKQGKAVLKTGNAIVSIAQFGMWADEVLEDFKGENNKDALHITNDILSIVPYIGQVINASVDVKDNNYLGAIKSMGILVLLEVFPELLLPVFLIDVISSSIIKNSQQKDMISKAVWNILMERKQLLDSQLETNSKNLAHICLERIQKIADTVERQLTFTANGIIHNIKHHGHKQFTSQKDSNSIYNLISNISTKLFSTVQVKKQLVVEILFNALKKTILEEFKVNAKGQITEFNEQTKDTIKNMLKETSKDLSNNVLDEALNIVEHYMKTQNISKTIKHELDSLSNMLEAGIEVVRHQSGNPLVYSHIGLNKDNKAVDKITNKLVASQNIDYYWGRKNNAIKFSMGNYLHLEAHLFSQLNVLSDFTIDFWIKVPLTKDYNTETSNNIPLIKNVIDNRTKWAFILNGIYLQYTVYVKGGKKLTLGSYPIANNKWIKITVVNNSQTKIISFFVNGDLINSDSTSWILARDIDTKTNNVISFGLPEKSNLCFMLDDFKVYTFTLSPYQIYTAYEEDKNPELLYDYFGNCVKKNRKYILAIYSINNNAYHPITQLGSSNHWGYNDNVTSILKNYDFSICISTENSNNTETMNRDSDIIYKNDNILLTSHDNRIIWGTPKNYEMWDIDEHDKKKCYLHVNNNTKLFDSEKIYKFDLDIATHHDTYCVFKIFDALNYIDKSDLFKNKNSISFALYKDNTLKSLLLANNGEILTVEGILDNKNTSDTAVQLPPSYPNISNDLEDYVYKAIFYLFPVDEIEYYID